MLNLPDNSFIFGVGLAFGFSVGNAALRWIAHEGGTLIHGWMAYLKYRAAGVDTARIVDHESRILRGTPFTACPDRGCAICADLGLPPPSRVPFPFEVPGCAYVPNPVPTIDHPFEPVADHSPVCKACGAFKMYHKDAA